ncbi:hypothetical protein Tco_0046487 [Tanacetum coccineum]
MPNVRSFSNKDLFYSNSSLHFFALFLFLDSSNHGVGISNSLSEFDKHTSLGEHSDSLLAMFFSIYGNGCRKYGRVNEKGLNIEDSPPNREQALDIDDSDLRLTSVVRPSNNPHILPETTTTTQTLFSSQNHQVDNYVMKPIRIIPGYVSIVQKTKLRKIADTWEGGEEAVMSTQEYIRKVIEDDNFTRGSWLSVVKYVNVDGGIVTGCFGDVKKFPKNGNLKKVVAIIKFCTPNALGDLRVTLKDLYATISGTIHYKVLTEDRFAKAIIVGAALILHNIFVFSPKQSTHHYINITKKNMVKVFYKDGGSS